MVHKPPYSSKRLVNVYRVRLNVYKIKDRRIPNVFVEGQLKIIGLTFKGSTDSDKCLFIGTYECTPFDCVNLRVYLLLHPVQSHL